MSYKKGKDNKNEKTMIFINEAVRLLDVGS